MMNSRFPPLNAILHHHINLVAAACIYVATGFINEAYATYEGSTDIMLQAFHWRAKSAGQHGEWYDLIASKART